MTFSPPPLLDGEVQFFVTGDADLLEKEKRLSEITGSSFVDPDESVRLMGFQLVQRGHDKE